MSNYKKYLLRQLGIKESQFKPSIVERNAYPGIDPDELEQGMPKDMVSPTARPTPIIGVAIRGSVTGGLPSGADQTGISPETPTGRLGGYEPIPIAKDNSEIIDKTPKNSAICSSRPISEPTGNGGEQHAHQVQNDVGEPPQAVTGASDDSDDTLTLKSAVPKDIEVGGDEGNDMDGEEDEEGSDPESATDLHEGKHKGGCTCGFCANKGKMGKKKEVDESDKDITEDLIPGGKGDKMTIAKIAKKHGVSVSKIQKQYNMGIKVEMEHTKDKAKAREITLDHLTENAEYYSKLKGAKLADELKEGCEHGDDEYCCDPDSNEKHYAQVRKDRSASSAGDDVRKSLKMDSEKDVQEIYQKHKKLMNEKLGLENGPKYSCGAGGVPTTKLLEIKQSLQEKAIAGTMNKKESETFRLIQEVLVKRKL